MGTPYNNPNVIKLTKFDYEVVGLPPDFRADVYERHPLRGDVFLLTCAIRDTPEKTQQAAESYMKKRSKSFGTVFLPIESEI